MPPIILADEIDPEIPDEILDHPLMLAQMSESEFVEWTQSHEKTRVEWVNGEVVFMSPVSARHVRVFGWLYQVLAIYVSERKLGEVLGSEFTIRLQNQQRVSRRVPDLMFVRQDRMHLIQRNHLEGAPDLAVEIVSPDSVKRDWNEKLVEYEASGVREYWIIDPLLEQIEAFTLHSTGKFISNGKQQSGVLMASVVDGFQIQVEWLWSESPPSVLNALKGLGI